DLLESVLGNAPPEVVLAERMEPPPSRALAEAKRRGLEGIIVKARGSTYEPRRAKTWLKLKVIQEQEVAIVGWLRVVNRARQVGALVVAGAEGKKLVFAGKGGTGYSSAMRRELGARLSEKIVAKPPVEDAPRLKGVHWVEPELVAQVKFSE